MFSPGAQLVLAAPDKVSKLLVVGVVVMLDSVQQRRRDLHQRVVGHLLLLAAGVAVVQVVHLVCELWETVKDREGSPEVERAAAEASFHSPIQVELLKVFHRMRA